ncbi:MAG: hypothetical protein SF029_20265 [bacterium]|nr:hypothetical protein [bacterium]
MFNQIFLRETHHHDVPQTASTSDIHDEQLETQTQHQAEIRRLMYERIARGHALAEAEEEACQRW